MTMPMTIERSDLFCIQYIFRSQIIYTSEMFQDSELIWPALEMLLKVLGWIFWALVLLWAMGGVLNFPGSQFTLGIVLLVVVLGGLFGAAAYWGNRAIFIYGIW